MKPNEEAGDGDDNIYQDLNKRMKELGIDKSKVISECLDNEGSEIASSMKGYLTQYYENQNITQNSLQWQVYEAELRAELDSLGTDGEDDASENTASMRQTYFQQYPEAREEDLSKYAANQFPPSTVSSTENIDFSKSPSQVSVENIMSMREKYYEKFRETKKDLGQENPLDNSNKIDEDSEHLGSSSSLRNPNDAEQVLSDTQWQVDLAICIVVIYELQYYFREGQAFESMVEKSLSSWLNQNAVSNKKWDINVASFVDQLKQSEIKHGRMAMLAITSFFLFVETETGLAGPALATVVQPFLPH